MSRAEDYVETFIREALQDMRQYRADQKALREEIGRLEALIVEGSQLTKTDLDNLRNRMNEVYDWHSSHSAALVSLLSDRNIEKTRAEKWRDEWRGMVVKGIAYVGGALLLLNWSLIQEAIRRWLLGEG